VGPSLSLQKCITLPCNYFRISELGRDFCVLIDKSEHTGVYSLTACVNKTAILWDDVVKLVQLYRHFKGTCLDDGGSSFL